MTQLEVRIDENFSKIFSDHLEQIKSHQNDLFEEWLTSLPTLEASKEDGEEIIYEWKRKVA